jgi:hypothetical protein
MARDECLNVRLFRVLAKQLTSYFRRIKTKSQVKPITNASQGRKIEATRDRNSLDVASSSLRDALEAREGGEVDSPPTEFGRVA